MRRLCLNLAAVLLLGTAAQAQIVVNPFETTAQDSLFDLLGTGLGSTQFGSMTLTDDPSNPFAGTAALNCEWRIHTTESFGGFLQLIHIRPDSGASFYDFSTHEFLSLRFDNKVMSSDPGVNMRFKLHEASDTDVNAGQWEDWYYETANVYNNPAGWTELLIPLKEIPNAINTPPNDQGFSIPGWSGVPGNQKLDLNKVVGYSIEWTAPILVPDTATGNISYDALTLVDDRYQVFSKFDSASTDASISFAGSGSSSTTLTDETSDFVEGTASMKVDWMVDATEPFGGFALIIDTTETVLNDMAANTSILLNYKNPVPSSIPGNVVLRIHLYDYSDGVQEVWYYQNNSVMDVQTTEWQQLLIPLIDNGYGPPPNESGFSNPGWSGLPGNQQLDFDQIKGFVIEFSAATQGTNTSGTMLFDYMTAYGKRILDPGPPPPPAPVAVAPGSYYNLVTWVDPPNEPKSKYDIYYSESPITDLTAPGVEVAKFNVGVGVQSWEHLIYSPVADSSYSYYYAVVAKDSVGNSSIPAATAGAVTNTARGVATISLNVPSGVVLDGDLSEWTGSSITPIRMFPSEGAHIVTNTAVTDDNDLSVEVYLAADQEFLYIAFDVTDDVVDTTSFNTYEKDSPDLFIGLYDWHGAPHSGYEGGATPDYQFRFLWNKIILASQGDALVLDAASDNYFWQEKPIFPGYTIEAKISWADLATLGGDETFSPREGMRIPLDFSVNDADGGGIRQGIMTLSPYNDDTSYQSPSFWTYTWIGEKDQVVVGIGDGEAENVIYSFALEQNYPNPFNPETVIRYSLAHKSPVRLEVFNMLGQVVETLVVNEQAAGSYQVRLDGRNLASGIYFYRLQAGTWLQTRKMILLK